MGTIGNTGTWHINTHCAQSSIGTSVIQGDGPVGTLTSPLFQIRTEMLHYLVGGGIFASFF